jgi:hypothetical protein
MVIYKYEQGKFFNIIFKGNNAAAQTQAQSAGG